MSGRDDNNEPSGDAGKDLFGKIDALFEKRATAALVDKGLEDDNFPVLTDVIGTAPVTPSGWGDSERRQDSRRQLDRRQLERRSEEKMAGQVEGQSVAHIQGQRGPEAEAALVERVLQLAEQRFAEHLARQHQQQWQQLEDRLRAVVREELQQDGKATH